MELDEIYVMLVVNSNCDTCKMMQHELMDNPPKGNLIVVHVDRANSVDCIYRHKIKTYPTTIVYTYPQPYTIAWFEGFVDSKTIDESIQKFIKKFSIK